MIDSASTRNILITGTSSGIGKYLLKVFKNAQIFNRHSLSHQTSSYDAIIHCAFDNAVNVTNNNFYDYYRNNIEILEDLLTLESKKFIYFSSVNVYDYCTQKDFCESSELSTSNAANIYALFKLMSECIITKKCIAPLILRCSAMIGIDSRPNSLIKILTEKAPSITLSENSTFNYISHFDIANFIDIALKNNLSGIFNLVSNDCITLKELADFYNKNVRFGTYHYKTSELITNSKVKYICNYFDKSSYEVVNDFHRLIIQGDKVC